VTYGEIPTGLYVCHHCDNRSCVRPDHLFLGTQQDNMTDMVRKGRQNRPIGTRNGRAKLDPDKAAHIRFLISLQLCTQRTLAKAFGVNEHTMSQIKHGKAWT
jgi:hypothetical protein